ncbi:Uma2 family endonuclease [Anatilimnocola sp. NA78]|uniref:Uma2 family endonuclease n=1 Tax=Anatilimnocola sp. NA78 TaxID=3415683 RepID=UPI003CE59DA0
MQLQSTLFDPKSENKLNPMTAIQRFNLVSVDDYLAGELNSPVKHEYLGGVVYAMAGAKNAHNRIATNIVGLLHAKLRKKSCQPFNSDTKIRIRLPTHVRFYYPDASVICHPNPPDDSFQDEPVVLFEVISDATRRTDEGEKKDAYLTLQSLSLYAIVEQETGLVIVHRRTNQGFHREVYSGLEQSIPLPEIEAELALAEIYEGVSISNSAE